jgi:hypothetical protein
MPDWYSRQINSPYYFLIFGVIFFFAAVVSTFTGKTFGPYGVWAYRAKKPWDFWGTVAIYYLSAFFFIGTFLYKVN